MVTRELLGRGEKVTTMTATLSILAHGNSSEDRAILLDVHSNDANGFAIVKEHERIVSRFVLVRVRGVIVRSAAAKLEQHAPTNLVVRRPLRIRAWGS